MRYNLWQLPVPEDLDHQYNVPRMKGSSCNGKLAKPGISYPIKELYEVSAAIWISIGVETDEWNAKIPLFPSPQMIQEWSWIKLIQIF